MQMNINKPKKDYTILKLFLEISVIVFFIWGWLYLTWQKLPSRIHIKQGAVEEFDFAIPAIAKISKQEQAIGEVDLSRPITLYATDTDSYNMSVELFGFINFKETEVSVINDVQLKPVGKPVGIYLKTKVLMGKAPE